MTVEVFYPGDNDSEGDALRDFARELVKTLEPILPRERARLSCSMTGEHATRPLGRSFMKRALITGITGQDGSYLAEFLLSKPDYEVHGLVRRSSSLNRQRIDHLFARDPSVHERFHLHYADLADASSLSMVMEQVRPDEVYNLGARATSASRSTSRCTRRTSSAWAACGCSRRSGT